MFAPAVTVNEPDRSAPVVLVLSAEAEVDALAESVAAPGLMFVAVTVKLAVDDRLASPNATPDT